MITFIEKYFPQLMKSKKVYIVPTKLGFLYIFINFAIFLMGLIYTNNMTLLMSFLMVSYLVIVSVLTNNNLKDLSIHSFHFNDGFQNEPPQVSIQFSNTIDHYTLKINQHSFEIKDKKIIHYTDLMAGYERFHQLKISTTLPAELFRSWIYYDMTGDIYIYPSPRKTSKFSNKIITPSQEEEDFDQLLPYSGGIALKRIHWKSYAKTDLLYYKKAIQYQLAPTYFDYSQLEGSHQERMEKLSYLITHAYKEKRNYCLKLPEIETQVFSGQQHYQHCMRLLCKSL